MTDSPGIADGCRHGSAHVALDFEREQIAGGSLEVGQHTPHLDAAASEAVCIEGLFECRIRWIAGRRVAGSKLVLDAGSVSVAAAAQAEVGNTRTIFQHIVEEGYIEMVV